MNIAIAIMSGFAMASAAPLLHRFLRRFARGGTVAGWLVALLPLALTAYFASYTSAIARGETFVVSYTWASGLGVNLSFYVDGLSLLFALLISGIGALIVIYAGSYLAGHEHLGRFYTYLLMFMASMLGLALAGNIITLYVFWELTSISSYLLIGFEHKKETARRAALQALLVTGAGGLALLGGLVLLGQAAGSFELPALLASGDAIRSHSLYVPILLLVLLGAFTKSAQFPFHFWLPGAMEAPTPVSAYLHSATMVKAGVFLLARFFPVLGGTNEWLYIVTTVGAVTMLVGGILALYQTDLKLILAYSTVSALGTLVALLGLGTTGAITAAIVFLLAHALYKGALFMIAGAVDHETGTRDVERLGGLRRAMPITAGVAVLAAVSLAGFGPVLSFIGKELLLEAVLQVEAFRALLVAVAVLSGALFVAVASIVSIRPFFGAHVATSKEAHEAPRSLWMGPALLALLGVVIGIAPGTVGSGIVAPSVASVLGRIEPVKLGLWHGFNPALALSVVSVVIGFVIYRGWVALRTHTTSLTEKIFVWGPARWYGVILDGVFALAQRQTRLLQNGFLRVYVLIVIASTIGLVGYTFVVGGGLNANFVWTELRFYEAGIAIIILLAAIAAVRSRSRLGAVASLGVVGFGVALIFILYGAPDLALTQFLIETLTVILLVLVFYHLPRFAIFSSKRARVRDMVIALSAGALMTMLVLVANSVRFAPPISDYFAERSLPDAHGRNIVNVILVDFRGLDTLGEITVLAVAAFGVYALLKLRPQKKEGK